MSIGKDLGTKGPETRDGRLGARENGRFAVGEKRQKGQKLQVDSVPNSRSGTVGKNLEI